MSDFLDGKLNNQEIHQKILSHKYKSGYKPSKQLVQDIVEQFWFHDYYNSFISDEAFLSHLLDYLDSNKPRTFDRYAFYNSLFDQLIPTRKALHLIALEFEKIQNDAMTPGEYDLLLKNIGVSNNDFSIEWMTKAHLGKLGKREEKELFIWEHHTLSEFLVAEYLIERGSQIKDFQDLAISKKQGLTAFRSSWSGVLRFFIESPKNKTKIISWLTDFLEKYPDSIDDNLTDLLVYESINEPTSIKKKIFNLIYGSYFEKVAWVPVWANARLSKYVDATSYKKLRNDIKKWSNQTETFVRRGNVTSIIEGLLQDKNTLLNATEKRFWKKKFILFANHPNDGDNGVLQRKSLEALALFKDKEIITQVSQKCFDETRDSLVKDAFIKFCIATNPNSKEAIDFFIKGSSSIYSRFGLYQIKTQKGIEYFLKNTYSNKKFLRKFLKQENIFDKEDADRDLIKNIKQHANNKIIGLLKKLVLTVFKMDSYYERNSKFLRSVFKLINEHDSNYLFEILEDIKKEKSEQEANKIFWNSEEPQALLLTKDNVEKYFNFLKALPEGIRRHDSFVVYSAKRLNGEIGSLAYEKAVELKLVEKIDETLIEKNLKKQEKAKKEGVYKSFLKQLEPTPGKYQTGVFKYFIQHKDEIKKEWKEKDRKKLLKIAVEIGIQKINPREFTVKITDKSKENNSFTWTSIASYYGDLLNVVNELMPDEIEKHKQNIIDFIPYEFDAGSTLKFIKQPSDKDIEWVNQVMIDTNDDRRYLIPQTYIYLVGEYAKNRCVLTSAKPVLLSFITDPIIRDYTQRSALESLAYFIDKSDINTKEILEGICKNSTNHELVEIANRILVSKYKDKKAVIWRFDKLKEPIEHERVLGVHSVSPAEAELHEMILAKPLMELQDEEYLPNFLDLLDHSFKFTTGKNKKKYQEYVSYLWKTVTEFIWGFKEKGSFIPLMELEYWTNEHSQIEDINWLKKRVQELKKNYLNLVSPFDKLTDSVNELGKINLPAAHIASFLLKAQLVETRLRELILGINHSLRIKNSKLPIYRKLNSAARSRIKNSTLSQICDELNNYQSISIEKLHSELAKFTHSNGRNRFNHDLFNENKPVHELAEEAKEYTKYAEESLELIHKVWEEVLGINSSTK
ncbi:MAG: hypothetical protein WAU28_02790 [Candidatus Moraniibacteriota bacterium]